MIVGGLVLLTLVWSGVAAALEAAPRVRLLLAAGEAGYLAWLGGGLEIDVLTCHWCGEKRKLVALITDGAVIRRILEHLGLPAAAPLLAPARSPPELEFA